MNFLKTKTIPIFMTLMLTFKLIYGKIVNITSVLAKDRKLRTIYTVCRVIVFIVKLLMHIIH